MEERTEVNKIVEELKQIWLAIQSLNPDPTQTGGDYRKERRRETVFSMVAIGISVLALALSVFNPFHSDQSRYQVTASSQNIFIVDTETGSMQVYYVESMGGQLSVRKID